MFIKDVGMGSLVLTIGSIVDELIDNLGSFTSLILLSINFGALVVLTSSKFEAELEDTSHLSDDFRSSLLLNSKYFLIGVLESHIKFFCSLNSGHSLLKFLENPFSSKSE